MELLRISIENVLFHLSELFTYLNKVILLLGQRGSDNRGRTVFVLLDPGINPIISEAKYTNNIEQ